MRRACLSFLLIAVGCTDLPAIDEGTCGNLVLDADEDCDGFSAFDGATCGDPETETKNACFYVCDAADEQKVCPSGWACGEDGRCRRPSGEFEPGPGSPWAFPVDEFALGDVDGDGHADLVGSDLARITVRFGASDASFPTEYQVNIRRPEGPPTFGKLNDDDLLDVIVPIQTGLFALLGDQARTLEPVAYAPFDAGNSDFKLLAVEGNSNNLVSELLLVDPTTKELRSLNAAVGSGAPFPSGRAYATLTARPPVANVDDDPESEVALTFAGDDRVFLYGMVPQGADGFGVVLQQQIALTGGTVAQGAMFADVDGDGDQDLMVDVQPTVGGRDQVEVAYNTGGTFGTASHEVVFDRLGPRWPLAAANLTLGSPSADYVYPDGVYIAVEGADPAPDDLFPAQVAIDSAWQDAAIGDMNGDYIPDVAVASPDIDSILVLLGTGTGLFNTFRVDIDGLPRTSPRTLQTADYDGDLVDDLAFARVGGEEGDEMTVIFGAASGGFEAPVSMGRLGQVDQVVPLLAFNSLGVADLISDLLVLSTFPEAETRALAVLEGSSSRRMISPFTLDPGGGEDAHVPRRAVIGDFTRPSDGIKDIIAIAEPPVGFNDGTAGAPAGSTQSVRNPSIWLVPGLTGDGSLDASGATFAQLDDELGQDATFEVRCSTWAVGDVDGVKGDELVGLDRTHGCPDTLLNQLGDQASMLVVHAGDGEGLKVEPHPIAPEVSGSDDILLDDLDADSDLDLLALFRGDAAGAGGASSPAVAVFWNQTGALDGDHYSVVELPGADDMFMVKPIRLDDQGHPELIVATQEGLYAIPFDPDTHQYADPKLFYADENGRTFGVGDVNGDGLDDIAYLFGSGEVEILLQTAAPPLGAEQAPEEGGS